MATGIAHQPGGLADPTDVPYAGVDEWSRMTGITPMSPIVGGPGLGGPGLPLPYNVDGARSRIVSNDAPASVGDPHLAVLDDWRDAFNFRGSPIPWLLLLILVMLGFMQLRVKARAGKASGGLAIG